MSELDLRQMRATYYAMMTQVDDQIGRIVAHLKESGEYDNTLIVFTCDHGEMLGDHYCWGKEIYFDSSFHIPLIIRDPSATANNTRGSTVTKFTEAVDLMPTILDWLELEPPRSCDGHSLLPFLAGEQPANWRSEAHFEHDFRDIPYQGPETAFGLHSDDCNYAVIRGERYKYVHFAALPALLFDMKDDPGETRNLADDPAHRGIVADCAQKMLSWRLRHADRTLTGMHLTSNGVVSRR
jgi:arylsulfatase A-like enzyme